MKPFPYTSVNTRLIITLIRIKTSYLDLKHYSAKFICTYQQRKSKWMEQQSEIDGALLNPVSLTDLIKAQTKRKKG